MGSGVGSGGGAAAASASGSATGTPFAGGTTGGLTGTSGGLFAGSAASSTGNGSSSTTGDGAATGSAPYQGFDSGPRDEPPIDPGCTALYPFGGDGLCVQCRDDADCPPDRYCATTGTEVPYQCYRCRSDGDGGAVGCSDGEVCDLGDVFPVCLPDCRQPSQECQPNAHCDIDSGLCFPGCLSGADCGGAGGICIAAGDPASYCVGCIPSDAGCPLGQLCNSSWQCEANCVDAGITCGVDSYCSNATGLCTAGCVTDTDCAGATPFCETDIVPHACAQCLTAANCPPGTTGCFRDFTRPTGTCGDCSSDRDCPAPLTCRSGCDCRKDGDCVGFPATPICAGVGEDGGSSFGLCGCRSNADCGDLLCDPWQGETFNGSSYGSIVGGGVCVPNCTGQATGYCAGLYPGWRPFCHSDTGLCGGCRATSECNDDQACENPLDAGRCVAPCTYVAGVDSCTDAFDSIDIFCNTYTGLCQQCLDDYDCTGIRDPTAGAAAPICGASGMCVQCTYASQCPGTLPGCSFGSCGYCETAADCPAGQGFVCARFRESEAAAQCLLPCLPGDDAGLASVSDAGPLCPVAQPFCVPAGGDAGTWCSACRFSHAAEDCGTETCCGTFCAPHCL